MKARGLSDAAIDAFRSNYDQLITGNDGLVPESSIEGVTTLPSLESVAAPAGPDDLKELLAKTAVVKLNGGLGTSMGLEKAKSLLPVKDGKTFLDLIAEQIVHTRSEFGSNVRFILMNSFSTSADTWSFLREKHPSLAKEEDVELMQNSSCKVDAETLAPVEFPENPDNGMGPAGARGYIRSAGGQWHAGQSAVAGRRVRVRVQLGQPGCDARPFVAVTLCRIGVLVHDGGVQADGER